MTTQEQSNNSTFQSLIWKSDGDNFNFPERQLPVIKNRKSIALCFSGGGSRALSAAMGQMRALTHLGLMEKCQYLSCVSGGSWAGTIYTYYCDGPTDDQELLGDVTPPEAMNSDHLKHSLNRKNLAFGASKWVKADIAGWIAEGYGHSAWIFGIGQVFLKDFGLFDQGDADWSRDWKKLHYFTYDEATKSAIKRRNPHIQNEFHTVREGRPFLVINSIIDNNDVTYNFEYTPLGIGRPNFSNGFGGGFVEPFAFRTKLGENITPNTDSSELKSSGIIQAKEQDRPQTVADATGTSSAFYAMVDDFDISGLLDPEADYWSIHGDTPYNGQKLKFGDGGLIENYGLLSMIQREIELAIVFINTETPLSAEYNPTSSANPYQKCDASLPALFGYYDDTWKKYYKFKQNHVFPQEDFEHLIQALQQRKAAGEPMIVETEHKIIRNDYWGIQAKEKPMKVVWCYLDKSSNWHGKLNQNAKDMLMENQFKNFPNYPTESIALSEEQIVMLADFTCDNILEDKNHVIQNAVNGLT